LIGRVGQAPAAELQYGPQAHLRSDGYVSRNPGRVPLSADLPEYGSPTSQRALALPTAHVPKPPTGSAS